MKRRLCFLLMAVMLLAMTACGNTAQTGGTTTPTTNTPAWTGGFSVGYSRVDVTPPVGTAIGMAGYAGVTSRISEGVLAPLCVTCVAITDESGNTMLLYTIDVIRLELINVKALKNAVSEATGLSKDMLFFSATHTHSSPDMSGLWYNTVIDAAVKTGKEALADRSAATAAVGSTKVKSLNFVRHYTTTSGQVVGDNFGSELAGDLIGHTTVADDQLQVLSFAREGKKTVAMVNWQSHPSLGGTASTSYGQKYRNYLSSDYVGFCRTYVEEQTDCLFAFYLGASGNLSSISSIRVETRTEDAQEYGKWLGQYVNLCMAESKSVETGSVEATTVAYKGKAESGGIRQMEISVAGTGKLGFIMAPYEMFDVSGKNIREASPYEATFILTQTNGANGYIPTQECWNYPGCYEVGAGFYRQGTAELLVEEYGKLLNELYK